MTKLLVVDLSALTRVEFSAVVEVHDGISDAEVIDRLYDEIDGEDWTDDCDFWERGTCNAGTREAISAPTFLMKSDGSLTRLMGSVGGLQALG